MPRKWYFPIWKGKVNYRVTTKHNWIEDVPDNKLKPMQRPKTPPIWPTKSTHVILKNVIFFSRILRDKTMNDELITPPIMMNMRIPTLDKNYWLKSFYLPIKIWKNSVWNIEKWMRERDNKSFEGQKIYNLWRFFFLTFRLKKYW